MEIPNEILNKLICDLCNNYLSCGPISLNIKTNKISCGRCCKNDSSNSTVRYIHYETLAGIFKFPCKYRNQGCTKKVQFSNNENHEKFCKFRMRTCPFLSCKWFGQLTGLLEHFYESHPDRILNNPCLLTREKSQGIFLIKYLDFLFIYYRHSVRLIGDETHFKYTIEYHNNSIKMVEKFIVHPLDHSNDFNLAPKNFETLKIIIQPLETKCRFNCPFSDISPEKCAKHNLYFCKYICECPDCNVNIQKMSIFEHYVLKHGALRAKIQTFFHINEGFKQYCVLLSDDCVFFCKFSLACYRLLMSVFSPFTSDLLIGLECEIYVSDPMKTHKDKLCPKVNLNATYDWCINLNMYNYPMWQHYGLDLCVVVKKRM